MTDSEYRIPDATRLGRTALRVTDLDVMIDFYREVIGFDTYHRDTTGASLGIDGAPILVLSCDPDAPLRHRTGTGLYHNAFKVPSRGALGDALRRIYDRWELDGASDHRVSEALYLADPEGNGVEIYCDRPRSQWPIADDGSVMMVTKPLDVDDLVVDTTGVETVPSGTTLGHIHLEVSSLATARSFYASTLGFRVRQEFGGSAVFLAAGEYHHHIGVNTWHCRTRPIEGRGLAWFEILLPSEDTFAALYDRVIDTHSTNIELDGCIEIIDPDGIPIRIGVR